jgi:hypothetical protein
MNQGGGASSKPKDRQAATGRGASAKSERAKTRRRDGQADPTLVSARLPLSTINQIADWALHSAATRSEAICRLVELGLAGSRPMRRRSPKAATKARDLAGQQIDKLSDPSATAEEQQKRKRRLLKGPGEFRHIRGDLPKPKS